MPQVWGGIPQQPPQRGTVSLRTICLRTLLLRQCISLSNLSNLNKVATDETHHQRMKESSSHHHIWGNRRSRLSRPNKAIAFQRLRTLSTEQVIQHIPGSARLRLSRTDTRHHFRVLLRGHQLPKAISLPNQTTRQRLIFQLLAPRVPETPRHELQMRLEHNSNSSKAIRSRVKWKIREAKRCKAQVS